MSTKTNRPDFSQRLAALAQKPGVYLMKDADGTVIYVGKAGRGGVGASPT